jgi:hypothetical protein
MKREGSGRWQQLIISCLVDTPLAIAIGILRNNK